MLAVLGIEGTTMISLLRMLCDGGYRQSVLTQIDDPLVRMFWQQEFASWNGF